MENKIEVVPGKWIDFEEWKTLNEWYKTQERKLTPWYLCSTFKIEPELNNESPDGSTLDNKKTK